MTDIEQAILVNQGLMLTALAQMLERLGYLDMASRFDEHCERHKEFLKEKMNDKDIH